MALSLLHEGDNATLPPLALLEMFLSFVFRRFSCVVHRCGVCLCLSSLDMYRLLAFVSLLDVFLQFLKSMLYNLFRCLPTPHPGYIFFLDQTQNPSTTLKW